MEGLRRKRKRMKINKREREAFRKVYKRGLQKRINVCFEIISMKRFFKRLKQMKFESDVQQHGAGKFWFWKNEFLARFFERSFIN